jgi:uncharacterized membrane protein
VSGFHFIKTYCLTFLVFLAVDFIWLGLIAKRFYDQYLGHFLREQVNWPAAFLFYLLFVLGIMVFVVLPAFKANAWTQALLYGMLFGLVTYATFDLTNLALLKGWPTVIVVVDILWGMCLSSAVSTAGYFISKWLQ